jgi:hypothetical protein
MEVDADFEAVFGAGARDYFVAAWCCRGALEEAGFLECSFGCWDVGVVEE